MGALLPRVDVIEPGDDEAPPRNGETPEEFVLRLSLAKAQNVARKSAQTVVVGADTSVVLDGDILGKPAGAGEARDMLGRLRGRTHRVVTGVAVVDSDSRQTVLTATSTDVTMREYSSAEMESYVTSGGPFDKAGGYAVQDPSFHPATRVEGCYLNVVGLPLCEVVALLGDLGVSAKLRPDWEPPEPCRDCPLSPGPEVRRP